MDIIELTIRSRLRFLVIFRLAFRFFLVLLKTFEKLKTLTPPPFQKYSLDGISYQKSSIIIIAVMIGSDPSSRNRVHGRKK